VKIIMHDTYPEMWDCVRYDLSFILRPISPPHYSHLDSLVTEIGESEHLLLKVPFSEPKRTLPLGRNTKLYWFCNLGNMELVQGLGKCLICLGPVEKWCRLESGSFACLCTTTGDLVAGT
jgi:hypothetical protein